MWLRQVKALLRLKERQLSKEMKMFFQKHQSFKKFHVGLTSSLSMDAEFKTEATCNLQWLPEGVTHLLQSSHCGFSLHAVIKRRILANKHNWRKETGNQRESKRDRYYSVCTAYLLCLELHLKNAQKICITVDEQDHTVALRTPMELKNVSFWTFLSRKYWFPCMPNVNHKPDSVHFIRGQQGRDCSSL